MPGNLDSLREVARQSQLSLRPGRHLRRRDRCWHILRGRADRRGHASCRRKPCRPLDRRAGALSSRPMSSARSACSTRRSTIGAGLTTRRAGDFRFHHVSTDEVFGDLPFDSGVFTEETPYAPSSPYSASKAASDHFVRAWHETYGLPVVLSNCSNNYGPYHFPEKLIPLVILNALEGKPLPVYGKGANVRDWLYVEDHARALELVLTQGQGRRELQCRRPRRAHQSRGRRDDLRPCSTQRRPRAGGRSLSRPDHFRHRPPRP